jgi:hypothetical protein
LALAQIVEVKAGDGGKDAKRETKKAKQQTVQKVSKPFAAQRLLL